jgi:hypothetical protein
LKLSSPGRGPVTHVFLSFSGSKNVDGRVKPGHDGQDRERE